MAGVQSDLTHFIIDLDDDDCPDVGIHVAAYQGNLESLELQLKVPDNEEKINMRVRPFLASPLRLAATGRFTGVLILCVFSIRIFLAFVIQSILPVITRTLIYRVVGLFLPRLQGLEPSARFLVF